jgi:hypothetical protein
VKELERMSRPIGIVGALLLALYTAPASAQVCQITPTGTAIGRIIVDRGAGVSPLVVEVRYARTAQATLPVAVRAPARVEVHGALDLSGTTTTLPVFVRRGARVANGMLLVSESYDARFDDGLATADGVATGTLSIYNLGVLRGVVAPCEVLDLGDRNPGLQYLEARGVPLALARRRHVELREGPGTGIALQLDAERGARVTFEALEERGSWRHVRASLLNGGSLDGWVRGRDVLVRPPKNGPLRNLRSIGRRWDGTQGRAWSGMTHGVIAEGSAVSANPDGTGVWTHTHGTGSFLIRQPEGAGTRVAILAVPGLQAVGVSEEIVGWVDRSLVDLDVAQNAHIRLRRRDGSNVVEAVSGPLATRGFMPGDRLVSWGGEAIDPALPVHIVAVNLYETGPDFVVMRGGVEVTLTGTHAHQFYGTRAYEAPVWVNERADFDEPVVIPRNHARF